jgi:hypothetical protein
MFPEGSLWSLGLLAELLALNIVQGVGEPLAKGREGSRWRPDATEVQPSIGDCSLIHPEPDKPLG